jgi:hypothetical protein
MLEANAVNRCMAKIASMNGHLKTDFVTNASASNPFWPKLRRKAKVGSTIFSAGVSSRSLIAAAERAYEYSQNPPFELERLGRLGVLLNDLHAAPAAEVEAQAPAAEKVKALLWHELTPGGYWLFPMKQILIDRDPHPEYVQVVGAPDDLSVQHEGSTSPLDETYSGYQFVKGVRVERDEVEFHPTYKTSGRAIAAQEDSK